MVAVHIAEPEVRPLKIRGLNRDRPSPFKIRYGSGGAAGGPDRQSVFEARRRAATRFSQAPHLTRGAGAGCRRRPPNRPPAREAVSVRAAAGYGRSARRNGCQRLRKKGRGREVTMYERYPAHSGSNGCAAVAAAVARRQRPRLSLRDWSRGGLVTSGHGPAGPDVTPDVVTVTAPPDVVTVTAPSGHGPAGPSGKRKGGREVDGLRGGNYSPNAVGTSMLLSRIFPRRRARTLGRASHAPARHRSCRWGTVVHGSARRHAQLA
jgi:hypothetical protein